MEGMTDKPGLILQRCNPVEALMYELPGLHLVSYGGGDSFKEASTLYLAQVVSTEGGDALKEATLSPLQRAIRAAAADALASVAVDPAAAAFDGIAPIDPAALALTAQPGGAHVVLELLGLDSSPVSDEAWSAASWEVALAVSTPVRGSPTANLFFQGWLHGAAATAGRSAAQSFPLVGVFGPAGCIFDAGPSRGGPYDHAPCDGRLLPCDSHIHLVDPFAGGTRDEYVALLVESGLEPEEAALQADAEGAVAASSYHMGADMARVGVRPSAAEPVGSAWVVCVDRPPAPAPPRVLVTLLLVVDSHADCAVVEAVARRAGDGAPARATLLDLVQAVPGLLQAVAASARGWGGGRGAEACGAAPPPGGPASDDAESVVGAVLARFEQLLRT